MSIKDSREIISLEEGGWAFGLLESEREWVGMGGNEEETPVTTGTNAVFL